MKQQVFEDTFVSINLSVMGEKMVIRLHPGGTEGGYWVDSSMKGLVTEGETIEECVQNAIDAAMALMEGGVKIRGKK